MSLESGATPFFWRGRGGVFVSKNRQESQKCPKIQNCPMVGTLTCSQKMFTNQKRSGLRVLESGNFVFTAVNKKD